MTARLSRYIQTTATPKQQAFLLLKCREAFFGGAAGGGKSTALLMAALQYADVPGYSALLLRRTFTDLSQPSALMTRAREWLTGTDAHWNHQTHTWTFPSGATLTFGYLENDNDRFRYQGAEFQFIGFDELTQFSEIRYTFLFSRLRRTTKLRGRVPLRMRAASNPGGLGHLWVKERFITNRQRGVIFIPSSIVDNPHLDRSTYVESLQYMDPVTRAQMLAGDWDATEDGLFKRSWLRSYRRTRDYFWLGERSVEPKTCRYFVTCDLATSTKTAADYTVVAIWADDRHGNLILVDMLRERLEGPDIIPAIRNEYKGRPWMSGFQEGGRWPVAWYGIESHGFQLSVVQSARRAGLPVKELVADRDKVARATTATVRCEAGTVWIPERAAWREAFLDEVVRFPSAPHDDMVDCLSYAAEAMEGLYRQAGPRPPSHPVIVAPGPAIMNPHR